MGGTLRLRRFPDVDAFLAEAGPFLVAREAEHNLALGICSNLQAFPEAYPEAAYFALVTGSAGPVLAVVWTPPWQIVLSECDDARALELVLDDLRGRAPIGVHGPVAAAADFAAGWSARTGQTTRRSMRELGYRLEAVRRPDGVPGQARRADGGDRDRLIEWLVAYELEVFGEAQPRDPAAWVDMALAGRNRELWVWDDDGAVSLCGAGGQTPSGIRIGPVYTPPEHRRRGYASALVADVCQAHLDAGRRACFLFTDLTNPTSNHVYQAIGFSPISEVAEYRFEAT